MLHGKIRNDDFYCNLPLQSWNNIAVIQTNVATLCNSVVANDLV